MTRGEALRWGALLHDAAKPLTRGVRAADGRVTFIGHDARGAELAREVLGRLRASERLRAHVAALVRHHLRLGFLVHEPQPLARRTRVRLPARVRAGRGRRDAAVGRRPAGDARRARARRRSRRICALARRDARRRAALARSRARRAAAARRRAGARARDRAGPRAGRAARGARGGAVRGRDRHARAGARATRATAAAASRSRLARDARPRLHLLQDRRAASCRRRSSTKTSARSPSWTSRRPRAGMRW